VPGTAAARPTGLAPLAAALAIATIVAVLAWPRTELTYDVETDFISTFEVNARELLAGEPVRLGFHGPLYPATVAVAHLVVGGGWRDALPISWLAAIAMAFGSALLYGRLFGQAAAWGAGLALVTSQAFLLVAASASSDLLYMAITTGAFLLAGRAIETGSLRAQAGLGLLLGLALLTRTNALACLPLALCPLFAPAGPRRGAARGALVLAASLALPVLAWLAFAQATGATPFPQHTEVGIASTYFPPGADRWSGDANDYNLGRFSSSLDVILHDPAHVASVYARDFLTLVRTNLGSDAIVAFPILPFALPGLVLLALAPWSRFAWLFFATLAVQVAFVNLRAYDPRYNLFLVPFLGAAAGACWERVAIGSAAPLRRFAVAAALAALVAVGVRDAVIEAHRRLHAQDAEMAQILPVLRELLPPGAGLVARKPQAAFHLDARSLHFPLTESFPELEAFARGQAREGPVFLYYGPAELYYRPAFASLLQPETAPAWLVVRARSATPREWVLYEVAPAD